LYYKNDKEKRLEYGRAYYREHEKEQKENKAIYYENNKERRAEYNKQYYQDHEEELKEKARIYNEANKEKIRADKKIYRENNKEYFKKRNTEYYKKNRDALVAYRAEYYATNRDKCKASDKAYIDRHKEERKAYDKIYYENHKEKYIEKGRKRRSITQSTDYIRDDQYNAIWDEQEGFCFYCGEPMVREGNWHAPDYYNVEHINSLANGGFHKADNIVYACHKCNILKYTKLVEDWMPEILPKIAANPRLNYNIEEAHMRWLV